MQWFQEQTVHGIHISLYKTAGMPLGQLSKILSEGVFDHRRDSTVFVMFGQRLLEVRKDVNNNVYFYVGNMTETTHIDHMLVGIQGFRKIVIVQDIEGFDVSDLLQALDTYPIKDQAELETKCNDVAVYLNYHELAKMFLKTQRLPYFNNIWWWFNTHAVDFSPSTLDEFEKTQEFLQALKTLFATLTAAQGKDPQIWRNRICAGFVKKFNLETTEICANDHRASSIVGYDRIRAKVQERTDVDIDTSTWMLHFDDVMCAIRNKQYEIKCLLVFGEPNEHCQFSSIRLWLFAQILLEREIMNYEKKTLYLCGDTLAALFLLSFTPWAAFKMTPWIGCKIYTFVSNAFTPAKGSTKKKTQTGIKGRRYGLRGRSPGRPP